MKIRTMVALVIENKGKFTVITKSFTIFEYFFVLSLSMLSKGRELGERERETNGDQAVMGSTPTFRSGI